MSEIKWQTPPTDARKDNGDEFAAALRERPGEWALYREGASASTAVNIKRGLRTCFQPAGTFDAVSRTDGAGKVNIYVRYVGEVSS